MFATAITSIAFLIARPEREEAKITRYFGGDGLGADMVELPDGTHVSLGSRTMFSFDDRYGESDRIVYLEGEAYFEVAKQQDKPFIVKTKEQDIEALGTKFNVMAYSADSLLTTTLLEGSVSLKTKALSDHVVLKPDEQFIYNKNNPLDILTSCGCQSVCRMDNRLLLFPGTKSGCYPLSFESCVWSYFYSKIGGIESSAFFWDFLSRAELERHYGDYSFGDTGPL